MNEAADVCPACGEAFSWIGWRVGDVHYCCAECASGKPCACPEHAHGSPVPDADAPELVGLGPEDPEPSAPTPAQEP